MKSSLKDNWLVCRVCLKQPKETMQKIFNKDETKDLTQMLLDCGGIPIKKFDHYPDNICGKCYKYLRVAYKFRMTCQRSHNHLSRFIAPVVVEKVDELQAELTLELEEADEIAMKLEPDESMGIKQELSENDDDDEEEDDVVAIYEPMDDEDIENAIEEFETIERPESVGSNEEEYIEDFIGDVSTSDEEFVPHQRTPPKKNVKSVKYLSKNSASKPSTSRKGGTSAAKADQPDQPRAKRGPKPKKVTSYICDICGNIYPSQGRLTEHIKLHKGIKPHECEICGHAFAQTQQLARHMNTHTGNRPYKCTYCPAAFADLSTRNKHHRIHTNERPYVCDVCGKAFTYTNTLKFHKMIHTGEKPHVCDICGKGFQQAYKMRNHRLIHEKKGIKLEKIEVEQVTHYADPVDTAQILEI